MAETLTLSPTADPLVFLAADGRRLSPPPDWACLAPGDAALTRRVKAAGPAWAVSKLYYNHGFLRKRMQLLQDEFARNGQEGPFAQWLANWDPDHDPHVNRVTTRVHCAAYFDRRDEALRAHATQIDPDGFFFATPMEWQQRLWPTEEFELARSRVPATLPEDELFAGIEVFE